MLADRWRWLVVGVIVAAVAGLTAVGLADRRAGGPEPVRVAVGAEGILCAQVDAVPAEASSDGLQRGPRPEIKQDPRCDELAGEPGPGEVMIPRHSEDDASVGNVVLVGELRFDARRRCFYVLAGDASIGVVWPARFIGRVDPPRIANDRKATIVAVGDFFEVRGRYLRGAGVECGPVDAKSSAFIAGSDVVLATR